MEGGSGRLSQQARHFSQLDCFGGLAGVQQEAIYLSGKHRSQLVPPEGLAGVVGDLDGGGADLGAWYGAAV